MPQALIPAPGSLFLRSPLPFARWLHGGGKACYVPAALSATGITLRRAASVCMTKSIVLDEFQPGIRDTV